jgi:hypothetical protein
VSVANYKIGLNSGIFRDFDTMPAMHDILVLFVHLIVTVVRLIKPGCLRAVVAESTVVLGNSIYEPRPQPPGFPIQHTQPARS